PPGLSLSPKQDKVTSEGWQPIPPVLPASWWKPRSLDGAFAYHESTCRTGNACGDGDDNGRRYPKHGGSPAACGVCAIIPMAFAFISFANFLSRSGGIIRSLAAMTYQVG